MKMNPHSDEKIIDAWQNNAVQWARAVRDGQIESRRLVTDKAIIEAVLNHAPDSLLDIGCGEGWLVRELAGRVRHLVGVDVVPALIDRAKAAGGGNFLLAGYDRLADGVISETFDLAVCNFSLLGKDSVETLFDTVPKLLPPGGIFIVQTLHPLLACGELPYTDGWREGSWAGVGEEFSEPAPWYFRTLESWVKLFSGKGLRLLDIREPLHPQSGRPASIIFIGGTR